MASAESQYAGPTKKKPTGTAGKSPLVSVSTDATAVALSGEDQSAGEKPIDRPMSYADILVAPSRTNRSAEVNRSLAAAEWPPISPKSRQPPGAQTGNPDTQNGGGPKSGKSATTKVRGRPPSQLQGVMADKGHVGVEGPTDPPQAPAPLLLSRKTRASVNRGDRSDAFEIPLADGRRTVRKDPTHAKPKPRGVSEEPPGHLNRVSTGTSSNGLPGAEAFQRRSKVGRTPVKPKSGVPAPIPEATVEGPADPLGAAREEKSDEQSLFSPDWLTHRAMERSQMPPKATAKGATKPPVVLVAAELAAPLPSEPQSTSGPQVSVRLDRDANGAVALQTLDEIVRRGVEKVNKSGRNYVLRATLEPSTVSEPRVSPIPDDQIANGEADIAPMMVVNSTPMVGGPTLGNAKVTASPIALDADALAELLDQTERERERRRQEREPPLVQLDDNDSLPSTPPPAAFAPTVTPEAEWRDPLDKENWPQPHPVTPPSARPPVEESPSPSIIPAGWAQPDSDGSGRESDEIDSDIFFPPAESGDEELDSTPDVPVVEQIPARPVKGQQKGSQQQPNHAPTANRQRQFSERLEAGRYQPGPIRINTVGMVAPGTTEASEDFYVRQRSTDKPTAVLYIEAQRWKRMLPTPEERQVEGIDEDVLAVIPDDFPALAGAGVRIIADVDAGKADMGLRAPGGLKLRVKVVSRQRLVELRRPSPQVSGITGEDGNEHRRDRSEGSRRTSTAHGETLQGHGRTRPADGVERSYARERDKERDRLAEGSRYPFDDQTVPGKEKLKRNEPDPVRFHDEKRSRKSPDGRKSRCEPQDYRTPEYRSPVRIRRRDDSRDVPRARRSEHYGRDRDVSRSPQRTTAQKKRRLSHERASWRVSSLDSPRGGSNLERTLREINLQMRRSNGVVKGGGKSCGIKPFTGEPEPAGRENLSFRDWAVRYRAKWSGMGVTDDDELIRKLPLSLEGLALDEFGLLDDDQKASFDVCVAHMLDILEPGRTNSDFARQKLNTRAQEKGETVAHYLRILKALAERAYPNVGRRGLEDITLNLFIGGLREDVRLDVAKSDPRTVREAYETALRTERILNQFSRDNVVRRRAPSPAPSNHSSSVYSYECPTVNAAVGDFRGGNTGPPQPPRSPAVSSTYDTRTAAQKEEFPGGCWGCGKDDHHRRDCKVNPFGPKRGRGGYRGGRGGFGSRQPFRDDSERSTGDVDPRATGGNAVPINPEGTRGRAADAESVRGETTNDTTGGGPTTTNTVNTIHTRSDGFETPTRSRVGPTSPNQPEPPLGGDPVEVAAESEASRAMTMGEAMTIAGEKGDSFTLDEIQRIMAFAQLLSEYNIEAIRSVFESTRRDLWSRITAFPLMLSDRCRGTIDKRIGIKQLKRNYRAAMSALASCRIFEKYRRRTREGLDNRHTVAAAVPGLIQIGENQYTTTVAQYDHEWYLRTSPEAKKARSRLPEGTAPIPIGRNYDASGPTVVSYRRSPMVAVLQHKTTDSSVDEYIGEFRKFADMILGPERRAPGETETVAAASSKCLPPLFVTGRIEDVETLFMLDTGASISLLSRDFKDEFFPQLRLLPAPPESLAYCINGNKIEVDGVAELTVWIGGYPTVVEFMVSKHNGYEALLGRGWWNNAGSVSIDAGPGYVYVEPYKSEWQTSRPPKVQVPIWPKPKVFVYGGRTGEDVKIAAKTLQYVNVVSYSQVKTPSDCIFEPSAKFVRMTGLMPQRIVSRVGGTGKDIETRVPVMNFNDEEITLAKGTDIGKFELTDEIIGGSPTPYTAEERMIYKGASRTVVNTIRSADGAIVVDGTATGVTEIYTLPLGVELDDSLTTEQQYMLARLLHVKHEAFSAGDWDMGRCKRLEFDIDTGTSDPIRQPPRRLSFAHKKRVEEYLKEALKNKLIEPSRSPWSHNLVVVKKKGGPDRVCVDYRPVNSVTKPDAFPLPRIDDTIDRLTGCGCFSALDFKSCYNQIELAPSAKEKTAFAVEGGLFQYNRLPFGLRNAPAACQRLMEELMAGLNWSIMLIYIDDIIVFSRTFEENVERLALVLDRVIESGLKLSGKKCQFGKEEILFLGHIIGRDGVRPDPANIKKLLDMTRPKTRSEVYSFLGLANYYRPFGGKEYARVTEPLAKLCRKENPFVWDPEAEAAFQLVKAKLSSPEVVQSFPDFEKPFYITTDASGWAVGAVLEQIGADGKRKWLNAVSRMLTPAERTYSPTAREACAAAYGLEKFDPIVSAHSITLETDHQALLAWPRKVDLKNQQMREYWHTLLSQYDLKVVHVAGVDNPVADYLSRPVDPDQCDGFGYYDVEEKARDYIEGQIADLHVDMLQSADERNENELAVMFESSYNSELKAEERSVNRARRLREKSDREAEERAQLITAGEATSDPKVDSWIAACGVSATGEEEPADPLASLPFEERGDRGSYQAHMIHDGSVGHIPMTAAEAIAAAQSRQQQRLKGNVKSSVNSATDSQPPRRTVTFAEWSVGFKSKVDQMGITTETAEHDQLTDESIAARLDRLLERHPAVGAIDTRPSTTEQAAESDPMLYMSPNGGINSPIRLRGPPVSLIPQIVVSAVSQVTAEQRRETAKALQKTVDRVASGREELDRTIELEEEDEPIHHDDGPMIYRLPSFIQSARVGAIMTRAQMRKLAEENEKSQDEASFSAFEEAIDPKWRCPMCKVVCRYGDEAVCCDNCFYWLHYKCADVNAEIADELGDWWCDTCKAVDAAKERQSHDTLDGADSSRTEIDWVENGHDDSIQTELLVGGPMTITGEWPPARIKALQEEDGYFGPIKIYKLTGCLPDDVRTAIAISRQADCYALVDDLLFHNTVESFFKQQPELRQQLCAPKPMRKYLLIGAHDSKLGGGHLGVEKIYPKIAAHFYWPNMLSTMKEYVATCQECQTRKGPSRLQLAPLKSIPVGKVGARWEVDLMGPLKTTARKNVYVCVFIDTFSKWVVAKAIKNKSAETVARVFLRKIFCVFGAPKVLQSDLGTEFTGSVIREVCRMLKCEKAFSTPHRPTSNGMVERFNRTLARIISMYIDQRHRKWDEELPFAVFAYNTAKQASTGVTPFYAMFCREARWTVLNDFEFEHAIGWKAQSFLDEHLKTIQAATAAVEDNIRHAQERQKFYHDRGRKLLQPLKVGQRVLLHSPVIGPAQGNKFAHKWHGPFEIVRTSGSLNYVVRRCDDDMSGSRGADDEATVHRERLIEQRTRDEEKMFGPQEFIGGDPVDIVNVHPVVPDAPCRPGGIGERVGTVEEPGEATGTLTEQEPGEVEMPEGRDVVGAILPPINRNSALHYYISRSDTVRRLNEGTAVMVPIRTWDMPGDEPLYRCRHKRDYPVEEEWKYRDGEDFLGWTEQTELRLSASRGPFEYVSAATVADYLSERAYAVYRQKFCQAYEDDWEWFRTEMHLNLGCGQYPTADYPNGYNWSEPSVSGTHPLILLRRLWKRTHQFSQKAKTNVEMVWNVWRKSNWHHTKEFKPPANSHSAESCTVGNRTIPCYKCGLSLWIEALVDGVATDDSYGKLVAGEIYKQWNDQPCCTVQCSVDGDSELSAGHNFVGMIGSGAPAISPPEIGQSATAQQPPTARQSDIDRVWHAFGVGTGAAPNLTDWDERRCSCPAMARGVDHRRVQHLQQYCNYCVSLNPNLEWRFVTEPDGQVRDMISGWPDDEVMLYQLWWDRHQYDTQERTAILDRVSIRSRLPARTLWPGYPGRSLRPDGDRRTATRQEPRGVSCGRYWAEYGEAVERYGVAMAENYWRIPTDFRGREMWQRLAALVSDSYQPENPVEPVAPAPAEELRPTAEALPPAEASPFPGFTSNWDVLPFREWADQHRAKMAAFGPEDAEWDGTAYNCVYAIVCHGTEPQDAAAGCTCCPAARMTEAEIERKCAIDPHQWDGPSGYMRILSGGETVDPPITSFVVTMDFLRQHESLWRRRILLSNTPMPQQWGPITYSTERSGSDAMIAAATPQLGRVIGQLVDEYNQSVNAVYWDTVQRDYQLKRATARGALTLTPQERKTLADSREQWLTRHFDNRIVRTWSSRIPKFDSLSQTNVVPTPDSYYLPGWEDLPHSGRVDWNGREVNSFYPAWSSINGHEWSVVPLQGEPTRDPVPAGEVLNRWSHPSQGRIAQTEVLRIDGEVTFLQTLADVTIATAMGMTERMALVANDIRGECSRRSADSAATRGTSSCTRGSGQRVGRRGRREHQGSRSENVAPIPPAPAHNRPEFIPPGFFPDGRFLTTEEETRFWANTTFTQEGRTIVAHFPEPTDYSSDEPRYVRVPPAPVDNNEGAEPMIGANGRPIPSPTGTARRSCVMTNSAATPDGRHCDVTVGPHVAADTTSDIPLGAHGTWAEWRNGTAPQGSVTNRDWSEEITDASAEEIWVRPDGTGTAPTPSQIVDEVNDVLNSQSPPDVSGCRVAAIFPAALSHGYDADSGYNLVEDAVPAALELAPNAEMLVGAEPPVNQALGENGGAQNLQAIVEEIPIAQIVVHCGSTSTPLPSPSPLCRRQEFAPVPDRMAAPMGLFMPRDQSWQQRNRRAILIEPYDPEGDWNSWADAAQLSHHQRLPYSVPILPQLYERLFTTHPEVRAIYERMSAAHKVDWWLFRTAMTTGLRDNGREVQYHYDRDGFRMTPVACWLELKSHLHQHSHEQMLAFTVIGARLKGWGETLNPTEGPRHVGQPQLEETAYDAHMAASHPPLTVNDLENTPTEMWLVRLESELARDDHRAVHLLFTLTVRIREAQTTGICRPYGNAADADKAIRLSPYPLHYQLGNLREWARVGERQGEGIVVQPPIELLREIIGLAGRHLPENREIEDCLSVRWLTNGWGTKTIIHPTGRSEWEIAADSEEPFRAELAGWEYVDANDHRPPPHGRVTFYRSGRDWGLWAAELESICAEEGGKPERLGICCRNYLDGKARRIYHGLTRFHREWDTLKQLMGISLGGEFYEYNVPGCPYRRCVERVYGDQSLALIRRVPNVFVSSPVLLRRLEELPIDATLAQQVNADREEMLEKIEGLIERYCLDGGALDRACLF